MISRVHWSAEYTGQQSILVSRVYWSAWTWNEALTEGHEALHLDGEDEGVALGPDPLAARRVQAGGNETRLRLGDLTLEDNNRTIVYTRFNHWQGASDIRLKSRDK